MAMRLKPKPKPKPPHHHKLIIPPVQSRRITMRLYKKLIMAKCFVVMGFGKKTDFETGRVLDLDKSYRYMIKPSVEAAGLECIRADEIVHSGLIDVPMYEQLLNADVVVADLSTSNKNAYYELGIRHALRPYTTVVIAEDGIKTFPFDVNHVAIQKYHHLGEDIGFEEVMRFREQLTNAIKAVSSKKDKDSPVYTFLQNLTPPAIAAAVQAKIQDAVESIADNLGNPATDTGAATHSLLMQQADDAEAKSDWLTAKTLLTLVRQMMQAAALKSQTMAQGAITVVPPEDSYILQRLARATYKSKVPTEKDALEEAHQLLHLLQPEATNDLETLGLWGSIHKRLAEMTGDTTLLNEAIRAYEKGYMVKNDSWNGINYAYLLNVRAAQETDPAEAIADFVEARRTRQEVLQICEQWMAANPVPENSILTPEAIEVAQKWEAQKIADKNNLLPEALSAYNINRYWVRVTLGEAYTGLGEEAKAQEVLEEAYAKVPAAWMKQSTEEQLAKLRKMLQNSPLQYLKTELS